jgi:MFS family permease
MAILAVLLRFGLPYAPPDVDLRYGKLLRSLGTLIRTQRLLRRHSVVGACGFAAFSIFWTRDGRAHRAVRGRLTDRVGPRVMNSAALAMMALAFVIMGASGASLIVLASGVVLLDAGEQTSHISNQARIFALDPTLRNRLNAVYMVAFFVGGAAGSLIAGYAFQHGGWMAVCISGAIFSVGGIVAVNYHRRDD